MPDMPADPLDHPSLFGRPADAENQPTDPSTTNAQITNQGQMGNVNIRGSQTNIGQIDTQGGAAAVGPSAAVYDYRQTIITQNQSYDVRGLPNPYLGLRNFTYAERALFAGRDAVIAQTVARLTQPGAEQNLLFITGASGSGKSSLAMAGLLPALEEHYAARHRRTARATFRPSERPLAGLHDALAQLGGPHGKLTNADIADPTTFRRVLAQTDYLPLLVLDQFEEFFSQSDPEERDRLFALLATLPPFAELPLHLLITMRVDYLPDLFPHKQLYEQTHHGLELRVMSEAELSEAIQRPLQVRYQAGNKRWQSELVQRLAEDASADASYLPLLQVTLETLWQGGELALVHYRNLGVAIEARAEAALIYRDPDSKQIPRPPAEQAQIMGLFLDLVEVGSNDDSSRDVRRRRTKAELVGGDVVRARLIDELASARLLSVGQETRDGHAVEVVDIIHETLLRSWTRLHTSIGTARSRLQQRARFEESLQLWQEQKQQTDYLLVGAPLREGQALREGDDIAFRNPFARQFLATSVQQAEATRRRQVRVLGGLLALAVLAAVIALGLGFQSESRRQEATAAQATAEARRQEATTAQGAAETRRVEAVAAVTVAAQSQATAEAQGRTARARALAANTSTQLDHDPELSLLLAMQAISSTHAVDEGVVAQAEDAIHQALLRSPWRVTLRGHTDDLYSAAFSPDGKLILTASADGTARLWDTATGAQKAILKGHTALVLSAVFSPDGKLILTASTDGTARLWDTAPARKRLSWKAIRTQ